MSKGIRLYCGVNENRWNHHAVRPGPFACVAPVYGRTARTKSLNSVTIPQSTRVLQDSGAFSDSWDTRLSFREAYNRQVKHAQTYGYADRILYRATYDLLIDEVWNNGNRLKRRWSAQDGERAVNETVAAARWMDKYGRQDVPGLVVSAQGVDAAQYLDCTNQILPHLNPETDMFGLGGWCIIGKQPKQMMPVFQDVLHTVFPVLAKNNIQRVHIWGCVYPMAIGMLNWMCNHYDIQGSTDSAGPQLKPVFGDWGYGEWRDNDYVRSPLSRRGLDRARHCHLTRQWLRDMHNNSRWYRQPQQVARQLSLFDFAA